MARVARVVAAVFAIAGALNCDDEVQLMSNSSESVTGSRCCYEKCSSTSECSTGMFCCPNHHVCMDTTTKSTRGPNCDKCHHMELSSSSSVGNYMANWVKSQQGIKVRSVQQGTDSCYDLALAAIEHARSAGYKVAAPKSYVWSSQTVNYKSAQPGDIVQFASYSEKYVSSGGYSTKTTGTHHTAVVTRAYVSSSDSLQVEEQNPEVAHSSDYHFGSKTGGSYIVYRIAGSSTELSDVSATLEFAPELTCDEEVSNLGFMNSVTGSRCCYEKCSPHPYVSTSECSTGMFCHPCYNVCMDTTTGSTWGTWGPNCDKCHHMEDVEEAMEVMV